MNIILALSDIYPICWHPKDAPSIVCIKNYLDYIPKRKSFLNLEGDLTLELEGSDMSDYLKDRQR